MSNDVKRPALKEISVLVERHSLDMNPAVPNGRKTSIDDEEVRYKLNEDSESDVRYKLNENFKKSIPKSTSEVHFASKDKSNLKKSKSHTKSLVKPSARVKPTQSHVKSSKASKTKNKIKVNFWSSKSSRLSHKDKTEPVKKAIISPSAKQVVTPSTSLRNTQTKISPKVRHKVSSFASPELSDQHSPMVTVPDDLTVQFNEEEVSDLLISNDLVKIVKKQLRKPSHSPQVSPRNGPKRKHEDTQNSDLDYFAKYIVHKLRKMETNQRIYSENLINTVLMLGQLQQLNGKSSVTVVPPL